MIKNKTLKIILVSCLLSLVSFVIAFAITNIDSTYKYAWNDSIGWIDFYSTNNVLVESDELRGYASSSSDIILLNCLDAPGGSICGQSDFRVTNNTSTFELSGYAWNDAVGWISFNCLNHSTCVDPDPNYRVTVDNGTGIFSGWAWNDTVGWFSFNCINPPPPGGTCGQSDYKVKTSWRYVPATGNLISTVFDSQVQGGSAINTIMWQGTQPAGTNVYFQIAASNSSSGPWNYYGKNCTGASSDYYGPAAQNTQVKVNLACHTDKRYWRYKVRLETDNEQLVSPTVIDVIIGWSP